MMVADLGHLSSASGSVLVHVLSEDRSHVTSPWDAHTLAMPAPLLNASVPRPHGLSVRPWDAQRLQRIRTQLTTNAYTVIDVTVGATRALNTLTGYRYRYSGPHTCHCV